MSKLYNISNALGWVVANSDENNFTDKLDEYLSLSTKAELKNN